MQTSFKIIVTVALATLGGIASAQTATDAAKDAAAATGRAASAAVTPGDQNMGRTPDNRSGGLMGTDPSTTGTAGTTTGATSGTGTTTNNGATTTRSARSDRN